MIDEKTLAKWEEQKRELAVRIKRGKEQMKYEKEKTDKIQQELVGRYYIKLAKDQGERGIEELKKLMDGYLTLDSERALFGLLPLDRN